MRWAAEQLKQGAVEPMWLQQSMRWAEEQLKQGAVEPMWLQLRAAEYTYIYTYIPIHTLLIHTFESIILTAEGTDL
jgi:hypothetical protein